MKKNDTERKAEESEVQAVFVPALGRSIEAKDQADVEKQVEKALAAEDGDGDS